MSKNDINNENLKTIFKDSFIWCAASTHPGEEKIDLNFVKDLSESFDVYVNDAFSASHRKHASITGFAKYLPAVAGDYLLEEIRNINLFLKNKTKPNFAIIGGSKVSSKIKLLNNLIELFTTIAIGGAMANTFLLSNNHNVGKSIVEEDLINEAKNIQLKAKNYNCKLILPIDVVCSKSIKDKTSIRYCDIKNIFPNHMILDIGKKYGPIELSLLPIGAYKPRWFMKYNHMIPEDAVQAHKDLQSNQSMAIHFGTFSLGDDAFDDPINELNLAINCSFFL